MVGVGEGSGVTVTAVPSPGPASGLASLAADVMAVIIKIPRMSRKMNGQAARVKFWNQLRESFCFIIITP